MSHRHISQTVLPQNNESEQLSQGCSATLIVDKISDEQRVPSYIAISCAVSGYRQLNRYDATVRQGVRFQNVSTSIAQPRGPIDNVPSDVLLSISDSHQLIGRINQYHFQQLRTSCKENNSSETACNRGNFLENVMNGHSSSMQCTTHCVRIQKYSTFTTDHRSCGIESPCKALGSGTVDQKKSEKSFIQQRIERLYGPGALGMAFRTRRAIMERENEGWQVQKEQNSVERESPQLPSVFRHLRPEFRHQLPVKHKSDVIIPSDTSLDKATRDSVSEPRKRHIPVHLEGNLVGVKSEYISPNPVDLPTKPSLIPAKPLGRPPEKENNIITMISISPKSDLGSVERIEYSERANYQASAESSSHLHSNSTELLPGFDENIMSVKQVIKDGHYFLKIVDDEVSFLMPKVEKIENELEKCGDTIPEEVRGKLFAATGKTKLLIAQKVEQFKGLCHKNLEKCSAEEFPTTDEDLAGFWDMISIQLHHVKSLLAEADELRKNNWQDVPEMLSTVAYKKKEAADSNARQIKSAVAPVGKKQKDFTKVKTNEERRKLMRETINARRKATNKLHITQIDSIDGIEIYVPRK